DYRKALLLRAGPAAAERIAGLEDRIAELQNLQDAKVEEEQAERDRVEAAQMDARIRHVVQTASGVDQEVSGRRFGWALRPGRGRSELDQAAEIYAKGLAALQVRKRAIAEVVTLKKRVGLQLIGAWSDLEIRHEGLAGIHEHWTRAHEALERAVDAVAERGL